MFGFGFAYVLQDRVQCKAETFPFAAWRHKIKEASVEPLIIAACLEVLMSTKCNFERGKLCLLRITISSYFASESGVP